MHTRNWNPPGYLLIRGSDHLTIFNIVAYVLREFVRIQGENGSSVYQLGGKEFYSWCKKTGHSAKAIKNVALAVHSIYRQLHLHLPEPGVFEHVQYDCEFHAHFVDFLARVQSLDYVNHEIHVHAGRVFKSQNGMAGNMSTLGVIRHWNDKRGARRASIKGTDIPTELVERYTKRRGKVKHIEDDGQTVVVSYTYYYADTRRIRMGLISEEERYSLEGEIPADVRRQLPAAFATWLANIPRSSAERMGPKLLVDNLTQNELARTINERADDTVLPVYDLAVWYRTKLAGAYNLKQMQHRGLAAMLALPPLDPDLLEELRRNYPDEIDLLGSRYQVTYRSGIPHIRVLYPAVGTDYLQLPDDGVQLPGGSNVILEVFLGGTFVACGTSVPELKLKLGRYQNEQLWRSHRGRGLRALSTPDPFAPERGVPFSQEEYGTCVIKGKPLVVYATMQAIIGSRGVVDMWIPVWRFDEDEARQIHTESLQHFATQCEMLNRERQRNANIDKARRQ